MLNMRVALIALVIMLLLIVPVYAQDATPEPGATATIEATAPESHPVAGVAEDSEGQATNGITTLVLLIGLGAVALVGGATILRENAKPAEK